MARAVDFDLAKALASPSFTPGQRDGAALVELVIGGEEPACGRAQAALAKLGAAGRDAIEARIAGRAGAGGDTTELGDAATARLVRALGLLARGGDEAARLALMTYAGADHVRVRRAAITALGKLGGEDARSLLVARWGASDVTPDERRALAEALGKVGGDEAIKVLAEHEDAGADAELQRRRDRGLLMATREKTRSVASTIDITFVPPHPFDLALRCKAGLAPLLVEELGDVGISATARDDSTAIVREFKQPWQVLHRSRLWSSGAYEMRLGEGTNLVEQIRSALLSRHARTHLTSMTKGPVRYRIGFPSGHRRAVVWKVAQELAQAYTNDPTDTTWDIYIDDARGVVQMSPRKVEDPRFAWRVAEVPAASHPTVAAALAFVAGFQPRDRVWDPFVGSGAELVERARKGPAQQLAGTDLDASALDAARQNLAAASVEATLQQADARTFEPGIVDLIITNPPLGSRVQLDAATLMADVLPRFAKQLSPGGRLVWINPAPRRTLELGEQVGLRRSRVIGVDLGGVRGTLERWEKPAPRRG